MSFTINTQQGEKYFSRTFDRFLGGKCGSKYCQCRREYGGTEDNTIKIRQKKVEEKKPANAAGKRQPKAT